MISRHTFAARLVQSGVDLYTVQRLGRWKNISMIMRYAHHYPESLRPGVEKIEGFRENFITVQQKKVQRRPLNP